MFWFRKKESLVELQNINLNIKIAELEIEQKKLHHMLLHTINFVDDLGYKYSGSHDNNLVSHLRYMGYIKP